MTTLLPASGLTAAPADTRSWSGRERLRRWRGGWVVLAAVAVFALLAVVTGNHSGAHGSMDPLSYDPAGGRALATLLDDRGVPVTRLTDLDAAVAQATAGTTLVVAIPDDEDDLTPLRQLRHGVTVVLIDPQGDELGEAQPGADVVGSLPSQVQPLDCSQPDAVVAGTINGGGDSYAAHEGAGGSFTCYAGLVFGEALPGGAAVIDIGSADLLSNAHLGDQGNAALGIGLLSHGDRVEWLMPDPTPVADSSGQTPLDKLLPKRLGWAIDATFIAVLLLMLWRARRLGRVVAEPLPVVIRASETVEGLGRLYRAAKARSRAAAALRTAAVSRMAPRLGVLRDHDQSAIVTAVASRTGRPPAAVAALLYGPEPGDEPALVALADQLDALEAEVRRS